MTPRGTPLHDTLHALAEGFAHSIVRAVREASVSELADTRELHVLERRTPRSRAAARLAESPTRLSLPARSRRTRAASARTSDQLELLLDRAEAYADVAIIDPTAILDGSRRAQDAFERSFAPEEASGAPPPLEVVSPTPLAAPALALRPGEELLRAGVGGVVLRRRRAQNEPQ